MYFFNVDYRHRINGFECDIYLSDYKIAIEIDGYYWHKDKFEQDKKKAMVMGDLGVTLINIRQDGLPKVSEYDIQYNRKDKNLEISKKLMTLIYSLIHDDRLMDYNDLEKPINDDYYLSEVSSYPSLRHKTKKT
jgi:hypothetical protein